MGWGIVCSRNFQNIPATQKVLPSEELRLRTDSRDILSLEEYCYCVVFHRTRGKWTTVYGDEILTKHLPKANSHCLQKRSKYQGNGQKT